MILSKIKATSTAVASGNNTCYPVVMPSGKIYVFYIDFNTTDPSYTYSTDMGMTWSSTIAFKTCTASNMAIWYDRWSGIDADLVHVVYTDGSSDDTFYRNINLTNNTLSTEKTIFAGGTTASGGALSITRARGGNLIAATCIDAGVEYDTVKSTDTGANWSSISEVLEAATNDKVILLPGWNADNQDVMCLFWDSDVDEISVKRYDDSADTWTETSISTGMVDVGAQLTYAASVDFTNSQNVLIAWTAADTANADLKCWTIDDTTITAKTDVVLNSGDDQCFSVISIKGSTWIAMYAGKSDGSDIYGSNLGVMYKYSNDYGSTWSAEIELLDGMPRFTISALFSSLILYNQIFVAIYSTSALNCSAPNISPKATYQLGI